MSEGGLVSKVGFIPGMHTDLLGTRRYRPNPGNSLDIPTAGSALLVLKGETKIALKIFASVMSL